MVAVRELGIEETTQVEALRSEIAMARAVTQELRDRLEVESVRIRDAQSKIDQIECPFQVGDIVADELGVRYRVCEARRRCMFGIRVNDKGVEAHSTPRRIWSEKLTLVEA